MPRFSPSATPTPSDDVYAYERGSQAVLISAATGTVAQVATAKPVSADAIGVVAAAANDIQPDKLSLQVDVAGTGSWTALSGKILGSLDGIKYYSIGLWSAPSGGIITVSLTPVRYISVTIDTATIASLAPTATLSVCL